MVTRKAFLMQLAGGGWILTLPGCGGGGGYDAAPAPMPPPGPNSCGATAISGNHGHALSIALADLSSAIDVTYNIQGSADHNHQVTLSAAQLAQLKAGQTVTVTTTTTAAHTHAVTAGCS